MIDQVITIFCVCDEAVKCLEIKKERNKIETVFSSITSKMPRYIKARTENGFCLHDKSIPFSRLVALQAI